MIPYHFGIPYLVYPLVCYIVHFSQHGLYKEKRVMLGSVHIGAMASVYN